MMPNPIFVLDSKSPISGLSNDISFVIFFSPRRWLKWTEQKTNNQGVQHSLSLTVHCLITKLKVGLKS